MKKIIKVCMFMLLMFIKQISSAQIKTPYQHPDISSDTTDIYFQCLSEHIQYLKEVSKKKQDTILTQLTVWEGIGTNDLPKNIDGVSIKYIRTNDFMIMPSDLNPMMTIQIDVPKITQNAIRCRIEDNEFSIKNKKVTFLMLDNSIYEFHFDCNKNKFYMDTKQEGIKDILSL